MQLRESSNSIHSPSEKGSSRKLRQHKERIMKVDIEISPLRLATHYDAACSGVLEPDGSNVAKARRLEELQVPDCISYLIDRRFGLIEAIAATHNDLPEVPVGNVKM
jgi:hypothetical protein